MKIKFLKSPKSYQAFALLLHEYWSFQKSPNLVTLFRSCLQIKILFDTFRNVTLFEFTSAKQLPINEAANAVRTEASVFDWTLCPRPDGLLVQGMEASPGCSKGPLCPASDKRSTSLRELFRRSWLKPSCYLASLQPSRTAAKIVRWTQCDQIAKLFAQYFAIYNNENLPNGKNISKSRLKNMPITQ